MPGTTNSFATVVCRWWTRSRPNEGVEIEYLAVVFATGLGGCRCRAVGGGVRRAGVGGHGGAGDGRQPDEPVPAEQTERAGGGDRCVASEHSRRWGERRDRSCALRYDHLCHRGVTVPVHARRRRLGDLLLVQQWSQLGAADLYRLDGTQRHPPGGADRDAAVVLRERAGLGRGPRRGLWAGAAQW